MVMRRSATWNQYKKTFLPLQAGMWLAACAAALTSRDLSVGLEFLAVMQVGSVLGAAWAARFRAINQFATSQAADGRRG